MFVLSVMARSFMWEKHKPQKNAQLIVDRLLK